jgi:hypothetical protein
MLVIGSAAGVAYMVRILALIPTVEENECERAGILVMSIRVLRRSALVGMRGDSPNGLL